eukprot:scaffold20210_cov26-Tisochrysis_lutea.AAC.1
MRAAGGLRCLWPRSAPPDQGATRYQHSSRSLLHGGERYGLTAQHKLGGKGESMRINGKSARRSDVEKGRWGGAVGEVAKGRVDARPDGMTLNEAKEQPGWTGGKGLCRRIVEEDVA